MAEIKICRMRTCKQSAEYFKKEDKDTRVSEHYIRSLVKQRKIPVFLAGTRQLLNLDVLIDYLNNEVVIEEDAIPFNDFGRLRRIGE